MVQILALITFHRALFGWVSVLDAAYCACSDKIFVVRMTLLLIVAASSFRARSCRSSSFGGFRGGVSQICGIWEDHAHLQTDFAIALS